MYYDFSKQIQVDDLNTIYITGGGVVNHPFRGISRNSAMGWEEVVWGASLTRSSTFSLQNIDDIDIGTVRQVEIIFPVMNVEDFKILQRILHERYCIVNAFYVDDMQRHTCEMAITGNERKKIYNYGTSILGMRDVKVKFVATNRDNTEIGTNRTITYKANGGVGDDIVYTNEFSTQVEIKGVDTFTKSGKSIARWTSNDDGTGYTYLPSQKITMTSNLVLYAQWE